MTDQHTPQPGDPGRDRIEELLRRSLEARAQDVRPDPRTWQTVSARIRRGQTFRWAVSGLTAAAAVVLAAVVLPAVLNNGGVDFADPSQDPSGPPTATETAQPGVNGAACGAPSRISAVLARTGDGLDGTLWARCVDGSESLLVQPGPGERQHSPAFAPDGNSLVFVSEDAEGKATIVHLDVASGDTQTLMGGTMPAFGPDGRLAWVMPLDGTHDLILVGQPFSEPEMEFPVMAGHDGEWFDVRRLAWDASGEVLYAEVGYERSVVNAYRLDDGRQPEPRRVDERTPETGLAGPATADSDGVLVVERCCSDVEGDPFEEAWLRVLAEDGERLVAPAPSALDVNGSVWSGLARIGELVPGSEQGVGTAWSGGDDGWYLVGDGADAWLIGPSGEAVWVAEQVSFVAANPAVGDEVGRPEQPDAEGQEGLPHDVGVTRQRILDAARAHDYDALRALMPEDFSYSFGEDAGPEGAIRMLRRMEEEGDDPFALIERLLTVPYGTLEAESAPSHWFWPRPYDTPPESWTDADVEILRRTGATEQDLAQWRELGTYTGWRLGIDESGAWRYLVAGD